MIPLYSRQLEAPTSASQEIATPFPFMRLPLDIRRKVLEYYTKALVVKGALGDHPRKTFPPHITGLGTKLVPMYTDSLFNAGALRLFETNDNPLPRTGTQFWCLGRYDDTPHTRRRGAMFSAVLPHTITWTTNPSISPVMHPSFDDFSLVNNMSKVSRQLTYELGACLWQNAAVAVRSPEAFIDFANSRPTALTFVKGIMIVLDCREEGWGVTNTPEFLQMMQKVSDSDIDLNFFRVLLHSFGAYHGSCEFDPRGKISQWTPAFQNLKTREFDILSGAAFVVKDIPGLSRVARIDPNYPHTQTEAWKALGSLWKPNSVRERESTREAIYNRLRDARDQR